MQFLFGGSDASRPRDANFSLSRSRVRGLAFPAVFQRVDLQVAINFPSARERVLPAAINQATEFQFGATSRSHAENSHYETHVVNQWNRLPPVSQAEKRLGFVHTICDVSFLVMDAHLFYAAWRFSKSSTELLHTHEIFIVIQLIYKLIQAFCLMHVNCYNVRCISLALMKSLKNNVKSYYATVRSSLCENLHFLNFASRHDKVRRKCQRLVAVLLWTMNFPMRRTLFNLDIDDGTERSKSFARSAMSVE